MPTGIYIRTEKYRKEVGEKQWKKDDELYKVDTKSGCWNFTGSLLKSGYGQIQRNKKSIYIHRYFYEKYKKVVPQGYELDHLCKNKKCVNPLHLEAVTHYENCLRGSATKLTEEIVQNMRNLYKSGWKKIVLARLFKISRAHVGRIIEGKSWSFS